MPSVCTYRDASFLRSICCFVGNVSVNERTTCDASSVDGNVCAISASAVIEEAEAQRGKVVLTGKCNGNALVTDSEGLSNVQFSVPWRYEVSSPDVSPGDPLIVWGSANITSASGRIDKTRTTTGFALTLNLAFRQLYFPKRSAYCIRKGRR